MANITPKPTLIIADDHDMVRSSLKVAIEGFQCISIHIVREAVNALELSHLCYTQIPDIVILDVHLPQLSSFEFMSDFKGKYPCCQLIVLGTLSDSHLLEKALQMGADTFWLKDFSIAELEQNISAYFS